MGSWEFGEEGHADAAFGREGFVETTWCCGGLGPAWTVPNEAVAAPEILEGIVVVGLQVLHHLALDDGVGFVGGPFGAVVGHEADEGVVQLAGRFEVVDDFADVVVDALDHGCEDFHCFAGFGLFFFGELRPFFDFVGDYWVRLDVLGTETEVFHALQSLLS